MKAFKTGKGTSWIRPMLHTVIVSVTLVMTGGSARAATAPLKILCDARHAYYEIIDTINALLGPGHVGTDIIVHSNNMGGPFTTTVQDALETNATYYDPAGTAVPSAAPYHIFTSACTGYGGDTVLKYNLSVTNDLTYNFGFTGPVGAAPPAFHTAPGDSSWGSGHGVEWSLNTDSLQFPTGQGSLSSAVGANAGLMAVLRYKHPTWNMFDVKAALRQTARNWPSGYNAASYGYGQINYLNADALTDGQLLLQPPEVSASVNSYRRIQFNLFPFRQTRRVKEVLFQFAAPPSFQSGELNLGAILALGGTKVAEYADAQAQSLQPITKAVSNAYFVWFTADNGDDGKAHFSRIDTYSMCGPFSQNVTPVTSVTPDQGTYDTPQAVSLSCTDANGPGCGKTYYTTTGFDPDLDSRQYTGPIQISTNTVLKFASADLTGTRNDVQTKTYQFSGLTFGSGFQSFSTVGTVGAASNLTGIVYEEKQHKLYAVDAGNNRIVKMDSGSGGTTLGANLQVFGEYGTGSGQFDGAIGIALDATANRLFIVDYGNNRIVGIDSGSGDTSFGTNFQAFGGNGTGTFLDPTGIVYEELKNRLYLADNGNSRIVVLDSGTGGTTFGANFRSFGGYGSASGQFSNPIGISIDSAGNKLFVADDGNSRIVKMDSGGDTTTLGANFESFGIPGGNLYYMAFNRTDNKLYLSDPTNIRIVKVDSGSGATVFGANFQSVGSYGSGTDQFESPAGIALDAARDRLFIADSQRVAAMDTGEDTVGSTTVDLGSVGGAICFDASTPSAGIGAGVRDTPRSASLASSYQSQMPFSQSQ
jgi:sugar lactone lactonase YvrE